MVGVLAGCLGGGEGGGPTPVAVPDSAQCDVCGMVIANHPGPNGQIFLASATPDGHPNPARFDSLKACLFPYLFERRRDDRTVAATYVTDYSAVEYDLSTQGGVTYVSSHTAPESFAPAEDLHYVVGSDVEGAMGADFYPFSAKADAEEFAAEHGGSVAQFQDIDETLVGK